MNLIILYRFKCALNYITNLFNWFQIARGYCKHACISPPTIHSVGANTLRFPEEGGGTRSFKVPFRFETGKSSVGVFMTGKYFEKNM